MKTRLSPGERLQKYLEKIPGAISGQNGHGATFTAIANAWRKFGSEVSSSEFFEAICIWNEACDPPWSDDELRHKFEDVCRRISPESSGQTPNSGSGRSSSKKKSLSQMLLDLGLKPFAMNQQSKANLDRLAAAKPPIRAVHIANSHVLLGEWYDGNPIVGLPYFRSLKENESPVAVTVLRSDGARLPAYGKLPERKTHLLKEASTGEGFFFAGHRNRLIDASHVLWCEGAPDALAAVSLFPPNWAAVSNCLGAQENIRFWSDPKNGEILPILAGKTVIAIGDNDPSGKGQRAARARAQALANLRLEGTKVYLIEAPPAEKDLRDWLAAGNGFPEFEDLFAAAEEILAEAETIVRESGQPGERESAGKKPERPANSIRSFDREDMTDIGNARHFATRNKSRILYVSTWKKWITWDGQRWSPDVDGAAIRLAKDVVREIFEEAWTIEKNEKELAFAAKSGTLQRIQAMLTLAGPEMAVQPGDLDQNEWFLNCWNGTVDLRTGELREHRREDLITKLCPTIYDPNSECPIWLQFLNQVFADDAELIGFVRRLLGYSLTASVQEQILAIFHGLGANGKSTLLNAFLGALGPDYAMQGQPDFLVEKYGEAHPTERADLFGRRFVVCSETESSRKLDEAKVKLLTGGERIRARRMREDFWEFPPTHKLILCTNHKPIVKGTDHGIWRRLMLVPFTQRFEGAAKDPDLPAKLKSEYSGILSWAVAGCAEWLQDGLNPPPIVLDATSEYRSSEDIIGRFIEGNCMKDASGSVLFKHFYGRLEAWCEDSGDYCPTKRAVGGWLKDNGFSPSHSNGRAYSGLTLLPDL